MQRYSSQQFILLKTPRPAEREVRFSPAPDKSVHRPYKEDESHV